MSYADNQTTLITLIENLSYRRLPNLLKVDESIKSHGEKGYALKPTGSDDYVNTTSDSYITTDLVRVEVVYKNVNDDERAANYDLFLALEDAIQESSLFKGWKTREFSELNNFNFYSRGVLVFYWGVRSC
jgi:hypothetical protein